MFVYFPSCQIKGKRCPLYTYDLVIMHYFWHIRVHSYIHDYSRLKTCTPDIESYSRRVARIYQYKGLPTESFGAGPHTLLYSTPIYAGTPWRGNQAGISCPTKDENSPVNSYYTHSKQCHILTIPRIPIQSFLLFRVLIFYWGFTVTTPNRKGRNLYRFQFF